MKCNRFTHDSIALRGAGVVTIVQQRQGFRFTLDSLLLADFCRLKPHDRVFEPGAGTGIVSLLLAQKHPDARFIADEPEPAAFDLLVENIKSNGLSRSITPVQWDVMDVTVSMIRKPCDVIIANPPYVRTGAGMTSPDPGRAAARQGASIAGWLDLRKLMKNKGRFFLIFPAARLAEILCLLRERRLEPKRLRFIHPREGKNASLVLIESVKSSGSGLIVLPPLILHQPDNSFSPEIQQLLNSS